jgi:hypothetical protein
MPFLGENRMKNNWVMRISLLLGCLCATGSASALVINNPAPAAFGPDIGGTGKFLPNDTVISVEVLDTGATLGIGGSEFGFYFTANPGVLIPIFEASDENPDPGGPGDTPQTALIDFTSGQVFDGDGGVLQNVFAAGVAPIGFYLTLDPILQGVFGVNSIFTDPTLNPLGEDMAASFPFLDPGVLDGFLHGFAAIDPNGDGSVTVLGFSATVGVIPVSEPAMLSLFGIGLLGLMMRRRKA